MIKKFQSNRAIKKDKSLFYEGNKSVMIANGMKGLVVLVYRNSARCNEEQRETKNPSVVNSFAKYCHQKNKQPTLPILSA